VQRYKQVIWQTEWMRMTRSSSIADALQANKCDGDNPPEVCQALKLQNDVASGAGGLSSYVAVQFAQRFWVQARFDTVGWPMGDLKDPIYRGTGLIAFVPTEFSAIRLQYSYTRGFSLTHDMAQTKNVHQVMLQFNVSIGAHPAHGY